SCGLSSVAASASHAIQARVAWCRSSHRGDPEQHAGMLMPTADSLSSLRRCLLTTGFLDSCIVNIAGRMILGVCLAATAASQGALAQDWPMFGGNVQSTSANLQPTGITIANVGHLRQRRVE